MPTAFTGLLNSNEIFGAIYNMIISQQVFADNIVHKNTLVDRFKTDGTLYGDTKLFYATDVLKSAEWGKDLEAENLLKLYRPESPECQKVTIDQFRQICLTVDEYLTKRAWSTEDAFRSFNSVMLGWIGETKRIYENTYFNVYIGTTETDKGKQLQNIKLSDYESVTDPEAKNRLRAQAIARHLADLIVLLGDYSRDYNDYANLRSFDASDFIIVGNSKYVNEITYIDLPTIFHKDGLNFADKVVLLPSRYFGVVGKVTGQAITADGTQRSLKEQDIKKPGAAEGEKPVHLFPGDVIPTGVALTNTTEILVPFYVEKSDIICKVIHKDAVPFMSAFETATDFFNPKSLTETHYLTWGYSEPDYLANYPFITIYEK